MSVINSIVSWACLLLLLLLLAVSGSQVVRGEHEELPEEATLENVCANHDVIIPSVVSAGWLVQELNENPVQCPERYHESFNELEEIISVDWKAPLCSEEKFAKIKEFHFRYINRPLDQGKGIDMPPALAQFFKAWALQVSGLCKRLLIDNLDKAMELMSADDKKMLLGGNKEVSLKSLMSASNFRTPSFKYELTFNRSVYLPELEGEKQAGDIVRLDEVKQLDLRSKPELNKFMHACERRFKPIYSKLIMPIVRLAKLGYEYVGNEIDDIRERLYDDNNSLVSKWLLVTMICESQGHVVLVDSDEGSEQQKQPEQLEFEPIYDPDTFEDPNDLWIRGSEALRKELKRTKREHSKGFKKFLYKASVAGQRAATLLDPTTWHHESKDDDFDEGFTS